MIRCASMSGSFDACARVPRASRHSPMNAAGKGSRRTRKRERRSPHDQLSAILRINMAPPTARQAKDVAPITAASAEMKWPNGWLAHATFERESSAEARSRAADIVNDQWSGAVPHK